MWMKKSIFILRWTPRYCVECDAYQHLNTHGRCNRCDSDSIVFIIPVPRRKEKQ